MSFKLPRQLKLVLESKTRICSDNLHDKSPNQSMEIIPNSPNNLSLTLHLPDSEPSIEENLEKEPEQPNIYPSVAFSDSGKILLEVNKEKAKPDDKILKRTKDPSIRIIDGDEMKRIDAAKSAKTDRYLTFIIMFQRVLSLILSVILASNAEKFDRNPVITHKLTNFAETLALEPIMSIKNSSNCSDGEVSMQIGEFPGTVTSCICNFEILPRVCYPHESSTCTSIPSVNSYPFSNWRSELNTTISLCAKRAKYETDYYFTANDCREGVECYPGICFYGSKCPLTSILLSKNPASPNPLSSDQIFITPVSNQSETFLIDVDVSYFGLPCKYEKFGPRGSKAMYPSLNLETLLCKEEYIDRSTFLIGKSLESFLLNMNIPKSYFDQLPSYSKYNKDLELSFYGRRRSAMKKDVSCNTFRPGRLRDSASGIKKIFSVLDTPAAVGEITSSFTLFVAVVVVIARLKTNLWTFFIISLSADVMLWIAVSAVEFMSVNDIFSGLQTLNNFKSCLIDQNGFTLKDELDVFIDGNIIPLKNVLISLCVINTFFGSILIVLSCIRMKK